MWKESEFSSKRDDDSAIGDSPNNSAGEESINSRRKSSTSDDPEDELAYSHVTAKLGIKVPQCLLQNADESLKSCVQLGKRNTETKTSQTKRTIKVLPASAIMTKSNHVKSSEESIRKADHSSNEVFQAKLQHLLFEMKQLRELDSDILRKFVRLNDQIDEMRWHLEQREADLKGNLGQDDDDVADFGIFNPVRRSPWEDELHRLSDDEQEDESQDEDEEEMKFIAPITKASTAYASLTSVKSSLCSLDESSATSGEKSASGIEYPTAATSKSYANPTYCHVDSSGNLINERTARGRPGAVYATAEKQSYYRTKPLSLTSTNQAQPSVQSKPEPPHRPRSANVSGKKYVPAPAPAPHRPRAFQSTASAFRPVRENQVVHHQRPPTDPREFFQKPHDGRRVSDFQNARDYQNLIDLSRVRGDVNQISMKPGSRTSTSSLASTVSSGSSGSSLRSPTRVNSSRSSGNKWSRFSLNKNKPSSAAPPNERTLSHQNSGALIAPRQSLIKRTSISRRNGDVVPRDSKVIGVSYKRHTSNDSVYNWIQTQQDDVTYL